ncbi:MAG TPA: energy transducer TonB [Acidobacteriota bacterium]|nr:energy transducer TonB [Acidobacteriota bacterium]
MYLPRMTGGGATGGGSGEGSGEEEEEAAGSTSEAAGRVGMTYPGPQEILSDFDEPTSQSQTLLRPDLENLPVLKTPIALPNVVVIPNLFAPPPAPAVATPTEQPPQDSPVGPQAASVDPEPPLPEPKPTIALSQAVPVDTVPFLPLPFADAELAPRLAQPTPVLADTARPGFTEDAPLEAEIELQPSDGIAPEAPPSPETPQLQSPETDLPSLLALSPFPGAARLPPDLPFGEVRGRFAISPEAESGASETDPDLGASIDADSPGSGDATTPAGVGSGSGSGRYPTVVTIDFGSGRGGSGAGSGTGHGTGSGEGLGVGAGSDAGSGSGRGSGGGEGVGAGGGAAPLSGITIIGGATGGGIAQSPVVLARTTLPVRSSYGIFVLSTETSGGGLPTFGVFENQQVYTVYLDMNEGETDSAPMWILEYGVPAATAHVSLRESEESDQGLVLPFPVVKRHPDLPSELVEGHRGNMVIVYGRIAADGRLEEVSIKQSPDPLLNAPVLDALSQWKFRPALLDGTPVSAGMLMGIPLGPPETNR